MEPSQTEELLELMRQAVKELSEIRAMVKLQYPGQQRTLQAIQESVGTLAQGLKK